MANSLAGTKAKLRFSNKGAYGFIFFFLGLTIAGSATGYPASPRSYRPHAYAGISGDTDTLLLKKAADEIRQGRYGEVHSMLLFKDNKIVFEEYFPGHQYQWDGPNHHGVLVNWDKSMLHGVRSVSKSITSLCIGIAIDKGFIRSVEQSVFDFLPDHQQLKTGVKEKITIEHLLTMTAGLEWEEWKTALSSEKNDIVGIWLQEKDPVTYILEKPLINPPGQVFNYSGGNAILLGEIIRKATGMDLEKFANEYLFKPAGIDTSAWPLRFKNGVIEAGGGLEMSPADLIKIGALCLNKGTLNGQRIIAEHWFEKCSTRYANNTSIFIPGHFSGSHEYGYSWWLKTFKKAGKEINMYHATGWGGQELIIIPELNAAVVFTGGNYVPLTTTFSILDKYILPAIL
ncbi:MAG: serine hydrolase [Chitinophagales bacterium]|nr:serine hydrolase [Chitinophagales bacterium]